jgi:hypothetical protein
MTSVHAPEIIASQVFYQTIRSLASQRDKLTMLEIGSSTGMGSTQAFIEGISARDDQALVKLYCLEMFQPAYAELLTNTQQYPFIHCYNANSIALNELPEWEDVLHFYQTQKTFLNDYPLETINLWYAKGINYAQQTGLVHNGIKAIKAQFAIRHFDLVLIDGSEFTGEQDLYSVMGSKTIMLDDCMAYKCHNAFKVLNTHPSYKLALANMEDRHGYAVFQRTY